METRRYKMTLEYDGTDFVGWQRQDNGRSVQAAVEEAARAVFGVETPVAAAGRTDAGVHATGQCAHFDAATGLAPDTIRRALEAQLPDDVAVHTVETVTPDFHARFSASSRTYAYEIRRARSPLHRRTAWIVHGRFDGSALPALAEALVGTHDFSSFAKRQPEQRHRLCHMFEARWQEGAEVARLVVRANRFLRGMVRALAGAFVGVARGTLAADDALRLLAQPDLPSSPSLAPAHGLTLASVRYDPEEFALVRGILDAALAGEDDE